MCEPSVPAYVSRVTPADGVVLQNDDDNDHDVDDNKHNINSERLRYNTHKVAAFTRRREMVGVFLAWSRKSAQLAMYVVPRAWLHCARSLLAKSR